MPVLLARLSAGDLESWPPRCSVVKEIKLSWGARTIVVGKHRLDGIRVRERCAASRQVGVMLGAKDHRYIHAVRKVAVVFTHIVSTKVDECAVMYPDGVINRAETATPTTPPVPWSVCRGGHVKTIVTVHFPTTS
eukprot:3941990-Amphidinium_carterae.1